MRAIRALLWPVQRALDWALSFPMFIKILGIGVLAVGIFALLTLLLIQSSVTRGLQAFVSEDLLHRQIAQLTQLVLVGLAPGLLVAAGMAALLAHLVTRPIERLMKAAQRIGEGDFDARAQAICNDEIGHLAGAFNRMAERLAEYRRQVEHHERARKRLIERIVDSQEEERKRVSRELHDEVGQSLMALLLWVQSECRDNGAPGEFCSLLETRIRDLAEEIHRLARGMRPSVLDDYGLDSALSSHLDEIARKSGLEIDYQSHFPEKAGRLPDRLELTLFRIVQEAITNVLRHARAKRVSVVILRQHDDVTLLVEDDGCGFDPATAPTAECRLGLTGIKERAALFDGVCTVESEPGRGTTVRVKIPLREENLCLSAS